MRPDDVLVFYQHGHRNKEWMEIRQREFEAMLGLPAGAAWIARGTKPAIEATGCPRHGNG
jgi:hypothetical protein